MRIILTLLFLVIPLLSSAAEYEAVVHVASYHPTSRSYNEVNPGIGLRANLDTFFIEFGAYKNSISKVSKYVGAGRRVLAYGNVSLNLLAGVITGYTPDPVPFILPELSIRVKKVNLLLVYIPEINARGVKTDSAFGLSVAVPF